MWSWPQKLRYLSRHVKLLAKTEVQDLKGGASRKGLRVGRLAVGAVRKQRRSKGKRHLQHRQFQPGSHRLDQLTHGPVHEAQYKEK